MRRQEDMTYELISSYQGILRSPGLFRERMRHNQVRTSCSGKKLSKNERTPCSGKIVTASETTSCSGKKLSKNETTPCSGRIIPNETTSCSLEKSMRFMPFFDMDLLTEVPVELANEPCTNYDTWLRSEIILDCPRLLYRVDIHKASYSIEGKLTERKKNTCRISVINIYDTYGIAVVYSFLKRLYRPDLNTSELWWIETYLRASLQIILGSEVAEAEPILNAEEMLARMLERILSLSRLIMDQLLEIDSRQPKMVGELTSEFYLPLDLLVMIIRSKRISKSLNRLRV